MKRVLFIVYNMVPYSSSWGGCQRMYFLAQKLIENGDQVKIFALNTGKYNTYGRDILPNVEHIERPHQNVRGGVPAKESRIKEIKLLRYLYHSFDNLIFNEIIHGTGIKAYQKCKRGKDRIKQELQENQYDIAIVSAPPFCIFSFVNIIKKISPSTKIIMDYRDPWNSWHTGNPLTTKREKRLQTIADLIVCTTDALCDDMSTKFSLPRFKYQTVANGYMVPSNIAEDSISIFDEKKLNFVYTGTISFGPYCEEYRDSRNLLEAIHQLSEEGISDVCFTFVGISDLTDPYITKIKQELGDKIQFIGIVSSSEANRYVAAADIALVMHTAHDDSGRFLVSGKLYDYIYQQKFILSIGKEDGQHAIILRANKIGINATNTILSIKNAVLKCRNLWKQGNMNAEYKKLDNSIFSRSFQIEKYCKIIDNLQ